MFGVSNTQQGASISNMLTHKQLKSFHFTLKQDQIFKENTMYVHEEVLKKAFQSF